MTGATVRAELELDLIGEAAAAAGIDVTLSPGEQARAVLRHVAGRAAESRSKDGGELKRAGRDWERLIRDQARAAGFTRWDVAPLRGRRDLLDLTGTIPDGWLIGAKSVMRGVPMSAKLWRAADQSAAALEHLPRNVDADHIYPFQVIQRPGAGVGDAYAVTSYARLLMLAAERRDRWKP